MMKTRHHLREFRERNLILEELQNFALVPSEFLEIFVYLSFKRIFVSIKTVISPD